MNYSQANGKSQEPVMISIYSVPLFRQEVGLTFIDSHLEIEKRSARVFLH